MLAGIFVVEPVNAEALRSINRIPFAAGSKHERQACLGNMGIRAEFADVEAQVRLAVPVQGTAPNRVLDLDCRFRAEALGGSMSCYVAIGSVAGVGGDAIGPSPSGEQQGSNRSGHDALAEMTLHL